MKKGGVGDALIERDKPVGTGKSRMAEEEEVRCRYELYSFQEVASKYRRRMCETKSCIVASRQHRGMGGEAVEVCERVRVRGR